VPRRDVYHEVVKKALVDDGWTITHDPLLLAFGTRDVFVDLGAEAPFGAEKAGRRIAVEVKTFASISEVTDLERALGQYALYRFLLRRQEPERALYLAVPADAFASVFDVSEGRDLIAAEELRLLVFDPPKEVITRWIEPQPTVMP